MTMKESGIEWVGLIPDTWSVIPNKYVMHKEKNLCEKWTGEDVMSLTMNGVVVRDLQNPTGKMPATFDGYQYIENGDLLMCLFDIDVTPRCVGRVTHDGVTSPAYSNFKVHDNASRDYFYYYYLMVDNTKELLHLAKNLRHSFTEEQLGQLKVPMPPLSEQQAIADYLDETCSKIDEIIAEAKASIDEYKELKQSVILEAVTKGLDKNVEMKDSGVEWIGEIPVSWSCEKIRYIVNDIGDIDHYMPESVGHGIAYLMTGDLSDKVSNINFEKCKQVSYEDYKKLSKKIKAEIGDIIFARYASIGIVCYVDVDKDFLVSYSCVVIKPKHDIVNSLYMKYYLQSKAFKEEVLRLANSNVQMNVGKESLLQAKITVPFLYEQEKIVKHLNKKITGIDSLITEKQSLIADLEAYKKSLIYEVVTGKRRVV